MAYLFPRSKNIKAIQICYIKAGLAAVLFRIQELVRVDAGQFGDVHLINKTIVRLANAVC